MGNKSDYRRDMSHALLVPVTRNPWGNPMKSGIVSPAYDSDAKTTYAYGPSGRLAPAGSPGSTYTWSSDDQAIGNEDGAWWGVFQEWDVTPGVKTINEIKCRTAFTESTHVEEIYIDVWRDDTTDYTLVATSGAIAPDVGSTGSKNETVTPSAPFDVTLESGETYFVGLRFKRTDGNAATPQFARTNGLSCAQSVMRFAVSVAAWNGSTVSQSNVAGEHYVYTDDEIALLEVNYDSDNLVEVDRTTDTVDVQVIARPTAAAHIVKLEGVVVADTNAVTIVQQQVAMDCTLLSRNTTELDCGDSTIGQNDLIDAGNTVNLPDIDPGGGSEGQEGKTFDLVFLHDPAAPDDSDLVWQCRTLEAEVHSHAVSNSGTRTSVYAYETDSTILNISGTATIGKIRVGTKPVILVGDSQTLEGQLNNLRSPDTDRWGALPTEFSKERIWIMHGQSGLSLLTIYDNIFSNSTPGDGDGVEMVGFDALWAFCGIGVNDIASIGSDDELKKQRVQELQTYMSQMLNDILGAGDDVLLIGLPPYSGDTAEEAWAARHWNRQLLGTALAMELPFYNPWWDMVEQGTQDTDDGTFLAAYTADSGTHYNATGGAIVRPKAVSAFENATIDLRDAWS